MREREREREGKKDTGTQALMEQRCSIQHSVGTYKVTFFSKDKNKKVQTLS